MPLLLLEAGLRLGGHCRRVAVWYDPSIGFRAHPFQSRWMIAGEDAVKTARVRTNRLGSRGWIPPRKRSPGVPRILTLGDSYTFGVGVGDEHTYPAQLQELLREQGGGEVLNLSFPGWNIRNARLALEQIGARYQPDTVLFTFTMDDMAPTDPGVRYTSNWAMRLLGNTAIAEALVRGGLSKLDSYAIAPPPEDAVLHAAWKESSRPARRRPDLERFAALWTRAFAELEELQRATEACGAELRVLLMPAPLQVRALRDGEPPWKRFLLPQERIEAELQRLGIPHRNMLPVLAEAEREPLGEIDVSHPNPFGYGLMAREALGLIRHP